MKPNASELTIFISSPGDVAPERALLRDVIARINESLHEIVLKPYFSEDDVYFASRGPQEGIPLSSQFDLVVCVYWKRKGSKLLPAQFDAADGRRRTGSEYEFETAVAAARATHQSGAPPVPAMLVYRKTQAITYSSEKVDEERAQHQALDAFFERWIKDAEGHFLGYANRFANAEQLTEIFERHLRDWIAMQRRASTWDVAKDGSPFRGLEVFDRAHESVYFGRNRAILAGRAQLKKAAEDGFPVLWLIGASGSGKSSLLRAGLAPSLERSEGALRTFIFRPSELGVDLLAGLAALMLRTLPELTRGSFPEVSQFSKLFTEPNPEPALQVLRVALDLWADAEQRNKALGAPPRTRLLLGIDQAEELLTQRSVTEREQLTRLLLAWVESDLLWLTLSFRSDFYALMQRDGCLTPLKARAQQLDIAAPSAAEIAEMIEGPVRAAGLTLEVSETGRALRDELCFDANGAESLPMLEFALLALHQRAIARGDQVLRLEDYDAIAGAAGALIAAAEASLQALPESVQAAFPKLLRELVELNLQSGDRAATARRCKLADCEGDSAAMALIKALVDARLLTQFDERVRVAHESLFKHWPRAKAQIELDALRLDARRRLEEAHALWLEPKNKKEKSTRLLSGLGLQEGLDLVKAWGLSDVLKNYVNLSEQKAHRQRRNLWIAVAVFAAVAVTAGVAFWFAAQQRDAAQRSLMQAAERAFGRAQEALEKGDLEGNLAYLQEFLNYRITKSALKAAEVGMQSIESPAQISELSTTGLSADFSGDGKSIVVINPHAGKTEVWDVNESSLIQTWPTLNGVMGRLNGDGSKLVVKTDSGLQLLSVVTGKPLCAIDARVVADVMFVDMDEAVIAIARSGSTLRTWAVKKWRTSDCAPTQAESLLTTMTNNDAIPWFLNDLGWVSNGIGIFNQQGASMILGPPVFSLARGASNDGTQLVFHSRSGSLEVMSREGRWLYWSRAGWTFLSFAADGRRMFVVDERKIPVLVDAKSGSVISNLSFIPKSLERSGRSAISIEPERIKVWSLRNRRALPMVVRQADEIIAAQSIRKGTTLFVSVTAQGHLWGLNNYKPIGAPFVYKADALNALFTNDDKYLYVATNSNLIRWNLFDKSGKSEEWETRSQAIVSPGGTRWLIGNDLIDSTDLSRPPKVIGALPVEIEWRFSADDTLLARETKSGEFEVILTSSGKKFGVTLIHGKGIVDLAFDKQTKKVASVGYDGSVKIWELNPTKANVVASWNHENVTNVEFSDDGAQIFSVSPNDFQIRALPNGILLADIRTTCEPVSEIFEYTDQHILAVCSNDNSVRIWPDYPDLNLSNSELQTMLYAFSPTTVAASGSINVVGFAEHQKRMQDTSKLDGAAKTLIDWYTTNDSTRSLSAYSNFTVNQYIEREIDWVLEHPQTDYAKPTSSLRILNEAYNLDPGHPLILFALSVFETHVETKALWKRLSFPRVQAQPEYATRAAEVLRQDNDPVNAKRAAEVALSKNATDQRAKAVQVWANAELAKAKSP